MPRLIDNREKTCLKARFLHSVGWSKRDISKNLDVSYSTIMRWTQMTMKGNSKPTAGDDTINNALERLSNGESVKSISDDIGYSRMQIYNWRNKYHSGKMTGKVKKYKNMTEAEKKEYCDEVVKLFDEGCSIREVAKSLNTTEKTIRERMDEQGINVRKEVTEFESLEDIPICIDGVIVEPDGDRSSMDVACETRYIDKGRLIKALKNGDTECDGSDIAFADPKLESARLKRGVDEDDPILQLL